MVRRTSLYRLDDWMLHGSIIVVLTRKLTHFFLIPVGLKSASKAKLQDVDEQAPGLVGTESRAKVIISFITMTEYS